MQEESLPQVFQSLRSKYALKHLLRASGMARSTFYYRVREFSNKYTPLYEQIGSVSNCSHRCLYTPALPKRYGSAASNEEAPLTEAAAGKAV